MKDNKFNYYDITDGWTDYKPNLDYKQCQQLCRQNLSCLFAIHFFKDQSFNRKPLNNSKANTCILRNELNIQYGTQKDSSTNIYYLTGNYSLPLIVFEFLFKHNFK
jgi:hypothetical protein